MLKAEFLKWGNSLALRVPSTFAKEVGASEGKKAEMTVEGARARRQSCATAETPAPLSIGGMIVGITEENRHPEVDWGGPLGNEPWRRAARRG